MSQKTKLSTKISSSQRNGGNTKKSSGTSVTLETFFKRAETEYDCIICGKKVKSGLRRRHDQECRMRPDDDDVVFVEEVKVRISCWGVLR